MTFHQSTYHQVYEEHFTESPAYRDAGGRGLRGAAWLNNSMGRNSSANKAREAYLPKVADVVNGLPNPAAVPPFLSNHVTKR